MLCSLAFQNENKRKFEIRTNENHIRLMLLDQTCELLLDPYNGRVHQTGHYFGDRAIFTCNKGHQIIGPEERVCQVSGMWSSQEPYCKKRGKT